MDQVDRYVLGLAVLEGDRDARKILADLLEEQGERGLAGWARACKGKANRRLDLAIMLLPCREAVRLGALFADAAKFECEGKILDACGNMARIVTGWCLGEINDDDVLVLRSRELDRIPVSVYSLIQTGSQRSFAAFQATQSVGDAMLGTVEFAVQSMQVQEAQPRQMLHWQGMAKNYVREIASLTKNWITLSTESTPNQAASAVAWQIERARAAFNHLISPEEFPWPK